MSDFEATNGPLVDIPISADQVTRLEDAIEGELDGLAITHEQAVSILRYVFASSPTSSLVSAIIAMVDGERSEWQAQGRPECAHVAETIRDNIQHFWGLSTAESLSTTSNMLIAVRAVLEADKRFRDNMMSGWDGDPLADAIDDLRMIFEANPSPISPSPDIHRCPICTEAFKDSDVCATDITEGCCHAACLEGSPIVDLETGEPIEDGKLNAYLYGEPGEPYTPSPNSNAGSERLTQFLYRLLRDHSETYVDKQVNETTHSRAVYSLPDVEAKARQLCKVLSPVDASIESPSAEAPPIQNNAGGYIAALRAALEPFAKGASNYDHAIDPLALFGQGDDEMTVGDLRLAKAALDTVPLPGAGNVGADLAFPRELTDDLRDALSTMLWTCGSIAQCLRLGGVEIKRRAEDEQAFVLHWLIGLALEHGSDWRKKASERISQIKSDHEAALSTVQEEKL